MFHITMLNNGNKTKYYHSKLNKNLINTAQI